MLSLRLMAFIETTFIETIPDEGAQGAVATFQRSGGGSGQQSSSRISSSESSIVNAGSRRAPVMPRPSP